MNTRQFQDLIQELKAGDNKKLKSIFEEHASYCINKLLFKYKCIQEDAEDIYVDSILNFREKAINGKINSLTDLRAYLYATCKNMLLVRMEKEKRIKKANIEIQALNQPNEIDLIDFNSNYTEDILRLTEEALSSIQENCQRIFQLFYFHKLSLDEIANEMHFANANVVKVSKSRCFNKLIDQIKHLRKQNKYEIIE